MESEIGPMIAPKVFEGEGGSYYIWSSAEFPILGQAKIGAGKLVLNPLGLALPHYADSSKIAIVVQVAGDEGMEWFSIITSTQPFFSYLVGKTSLWKTLSPQVLQVSLNLTTEEAEVFSSKMNKNPILIPPPM
ncbi:uncharacterized protein LOC122067589 isoform X2 [Macadamia integrifolia]|uniref:uncharacterized protein LOC122067589 isoform X2 n=1 Tax=Macadamia integrifolia TaxID=60698 RepID=UPI001C4EE925|nr:uncharacterized protein LOC122067589 isoform X2 [Macadamia integrifolia]